MHVVRVADSPQRRAAELAWDWRGPGVRAGQARIVIEKKHFYLGEPPMALFWCQAPLRDS